MDWKILPSCFSSCHCRNNSFLMSQSFLEVLQLSDCDFWQIKNSKQWLRDVCLQKYLWYLPVFVLSFRRLLTFLGELSRRIGRNSFPFHRYNGENSRHLNNLDAIFSYNSWRTFDYSIFKTITILLCNRSSEDCNSHNMADEWRKKD